MKHHFKISPRFFSNLMIVAFSIVVLVTTAALSYNIWLASADQIYLSGLNISYPRPTFSSYATVPIYRITDVGGSNYLEIYNASEISSVMGSNFSSNPTYLSTYHITGDTSTGFSGVDYPFALLPLTGYNYSTNGEAVLGSPTQQFMEYAQLLINKANVPSQIALINASIAAYKQAALYSQASYRVVVDGSVHYILSRDPSFQNLPTSNNIDYLMMKNEPGIFPDSTSDWAIKVNVESRTEYSKATDNSIPLAVMNSALAESAANGDSVNNKLIAAAIANYRSQISTPSSSGGLTIDGLDIIKYDDEQTLTFKVDFSKLPVPADKKISSIILSINNYTACEVTFLISPDQGDLAADASSKTRCSWDSGRKLGTYDWDGNAGSTEAKVSTRDPGAKTITLSAYTDYPPKTVITSTSKTVNILADTSTQTSQNASGAISISTPASAYRADGVTAKISADLTKLGGNVSYLSWWVCNGTQDVVAKNQSTSCNSGVSGHVPKTPGGGDAELTGTTSVDSSIFWDTSGSASGNHVIQIKAYGQKGSDGLYPEISGSSTFSATINVLDGTNPSGSGGSNAVTPAGAVKNPAWSAGASFGQSALKNLDDIIHRLGSFTLYILGALAVIAIIIAGMKYISSGGDQKKAEAGKKAVLFAVYGIIAAILCVVLIQTTINEVRTITGTNFTAGQPAKTGQIIPSKIGGPTATLEQIFNETGYLWELVKLAIYYAELIAVLYILYGSFLYITSFGDDGKAESAKKTILWALIGLAVVISANYILAVFAGIII
ncbi:MAG: pilin [Candidatus Berkelbacteria bacterium]|nr:pilin [Candidatus Berkelbacteria bacterium]